MKRLLPVLCLFAMWVAPTHGATFSGFNQGPAYNLGWNLWWAGSCLVSGTIDTISKLEDRAEEVLKGKELSLYEEGHRGRSGGRSTGCVEEAVEKVITYTKRFLDSRENASNNLKLSPKVTAKKKTTYNPEHLERLKGTNSCPRCDLRGANLRNINLSFADLSGANLWRADFNGANLSGTNLQGASFLDTYLVGANLQGASLLDTNFRGSKLDSKGLAIAKASGVIGLSEKGVKFYDELSKQVKIAASLPPCPKNVADRIANVRELNPSIWTNCTGKFTDRYRMKYMGAYQNGEKKRIRHLYLSEWQKICWCIQG